MEPTLGSDRLAIKTEQSSGVVVKSIGAKLTAICGQYWYWNKDRNWNRQTICIDNQQAILVDFKYRLPETIELVQVVSKFIGLTDVIAVLVHLVNGLAIFVSLIEHIPLTVERGNQVSKIVFHLPVAIVMTLKCISSASVSTGTGDRALKEVLGCKLLPSLVRPPFSRWSSFTGHLRTGAPDKTLDLCFPLVLCVSVR